VRRFNREVLKSMSSAYTRNSFDVSIDYPNSIINIGKTKTYVVPIPASMLLGAAVGKRYVRSANDACL